MTPEEQQKKKELEQQIDEGFSQLQQDLGNLKKNVQLETDETKKAENNKKIKEMEENLSEINVGKERLERMTSLQEQQLLELKKRLESLKNAIQSFRGEVADLQNKKTETPQTYELLKNSETYNRLLNIISSNPDKFKDLPGETADKKLEYIFNKIREGIVQFMKNKLGSSENAEKIINSTIAPAFEWNLMELLRDQGNETNVSMLKGMDKISFDSFNQLVSGVSKFAKKASGSYNKFSQWMNAIDYLSVHNGVLRNPNKSEVLSNPLKFQEYMNDSRFADESFSPYASISDNIFKIDENQTFEFGVSLKEKEDILKKIGDIQVVNNPKTTALIAKMVNKPAELFKAKDTLQNTANSLLDGISSITSVTKIFGVDILGEITKAPEKRSFLYKIMDFVCKLIGITGGVEGIVKKWRLDRMNLTDEKNESIGQIFKKYKESVGNNVSLSITDVNSCKTALNDFTVTDPQNTASTKGDFLRDSIISNMKLSLISPAVVQQAVEQHKLGNTLDYYLKKETVSENGTTKEKVTVDESKFTQEDKLQLVHNHVLNMKAHLEMYNDKKEFYTNIHSTEDIALCITASLYVDKEDVIEGVKAKVFLPENYGSFRSDGTVRDNNESERPSGEVSQYKLSEGEYPFKDVPPYKGIKTYDLRNVKIKPVLDYSELIKKHEGTVTLNGANITNKGHEYPSNGTKGNKNNNPCDISHSGSDIGYVSSSKVADGQALAKYDTPVNGIASAMRLLKNKYQNKSITEIDVGGYQGYYKANEEIGLSALRIKWITDQCNALGVGPHQMLDFNDPMTLKSFVAQIAVQETGTKIGQQLLDDAYNLAFT